MKLIGIEVPFQTLFKLEPNTLLVVVSDTNGDIRLVKVDSNSIADAEDAVLSVESVSSRAASTASAVSAASAVMATPCGAPRCCLVKRDGKWVWVPC
jgi:hypothetical protein